METCSVEGCERPRRKRGWCSRHYDRWRSSGKPEGVRAPRGAALRFLKEASKETGPGPCILWPFALRPDGYARVYIAGKLRPAHAYCLELSGTPRPSPKHHALHQPVVCHNPQCVRPNHLRWGLAADNIADMVKDGTKKYGAKTGVAKLTESQVRAIRNSAKSDRELAEIYGVHHGHIWNVRTHRTWKHIRP